jgi:hypothetical protein
MFQGTRHAPVATPNSKEAQSAAGWMIETQANRPQQPGHSARGPHMLSPCSPLPLSIKGGGAEEDTVVRKNYAE